METPILPIKPGLNGCVYRLNWGEKYVIIKCKTYARSKTIIEESLGYFLRKGSLDKHYTPFFQYIQAHPFYSFVVHVLFQGDNPYRLLQQEQIELEESAGDPNCMNTEFTSYIPKKIQGTRKAWINRGHYLNFKNWLKIRAAN